MTDLNELLERVKKAKGPDREIDAHCFALSQGGRLRQFYDGDKSYVWEKPIDGFWIRDIKNVTGTAKFSGSIDATLDLVERLLPGSMWRLQSSPDTGDGFQATLVTYGPDLGSNAEAATAPLALLSCLFKSLISKESQS